MSANRLDRPRPPASGRSGRATLPSAKPDPELRFSGNAKLLVEAADPGAAQALFGALREHAPGRPPTLIQLSPGLYFAQAHPSGRYWTFEFTPQTCCE